MLTELFWTPLCVKLECMVLNFEVYVKKFIPFFVWVCTFFVIGFCVWTFGGQWFCECCCVYGWCIFRDLNFEICTFSKNSKEAKVLLIFCRYINYKKNAVVFEIFMQFLFLFQNTEQLLIHWQPSIIFHYPSSLIIHPST